MDNHKSSLLETMRHVSKIAGTLAGKVVVCGKEIADCVINLAIGEQGQKSEPSSKVTETKNDQEKKKIAKVEKKKTTSKHVEMKGGTVRPKPSSDVKTKAGEKTNIISIPKKRRSAVAKKKKSSNKTSEPTAKK
jgi:hypothetical protein